jgi:nucleoside-diphosphate-sugar epimerase
VIVLGAAGFVGSAIHAARRAAGAAVVGTSREAIPGLEQVDNGAALDHLLADGYGQVVVTPQLGAPIDWILDRIDGPRWVVLSSMQLAATALPPDAATARLREDHAISRGAVVLRPTMIFGHGRDVNLTRLIRLFRTMRVVPIPADANQLVQPIHVDDLVALIEQIRTRPQAGRYSVGGDEALPASELLQLIAEIVGARRVPIGGVAGVLTGAAARLGRSRADKFERLLEDKTADLSAVAAAFEWWPAPLGIRLEQAVRESERSA